MILLLGASGILGTALLEGLNDYEILPVARNNIMKWMEPDGAHHIKSYLESLPSEPTLIINAVGITNPSAPYSDLIKANFQLPANLVSVAKEFSTKIITFGTIMESFPEISKKHRYLESKLLFGEFLQSASSEGARFLHLQIHTWYGGTRLHEHMFLGQLLKSIRERSLFSMSSGKQLREYHYITDDLRGVLSLLKQGSLGIHQMNHGESYSLKEIAEHVMSTFGTQRLLKVGALPTPELDNFNVQFACPINIQDIRFRPTLAGIVEDFDKRLRG
jgi:nucleoside-diphosphate-sugar epimerase